MHEASKSQKELIIFAIFLMSVILIPLLSVIKPVNASNPWQVPVTASPLWTDTGLYMQAGNEALISATGTWSWGSIPFLDSCGPGGTPGSTSSDVFIVGNRGELIAFVGPNPYQGHLGDPNFFPQSVGYWSIGNSGTVTSDKAGELWLGINDDATSEDINDNSGSLPASITLYQNTTTTVTCSHSPALQNCTVTCTATVAGVNPTGYVSWWTNSTTGNFSNEFTAINSGTTTTTYTDSSPGTAILYAGYLGDSNNLISTGIISLPVVQSWQVTITSNNTVAGTVNPASGLYGSTPTIITATPNAGNQFLYWTTTGGATLASNSSSTTMAVSGTGTVEAFFAQVTPVKITNVQLPTNTTAQGFNATQLGFIMPTNMTILNPNAVSEQASVQVFANATLVYNNTVTLGAGQTQTIYTSINTTTVGLIVGNYTSQVVAITVGLNAPNTDTSTGNIAVTYPGDLTGDFKVDFNDVTAFVQAYIQYNQVGGSHPVNLECDYNHDGAIDFNDVTAFVDAYIAYNSPGGH